MPPLALSDSEITTIFAACRPLDLDDRDRFLQDVAAALAGCELGDGIVARTCAAVQARYRRPPPVAPVRHAPQQMRKLGPTSRRRGAERDVS